MRLCSATGVLLLHGARPGAECSELQGEWQPPSIFPTSRMPQSLIAVPLKPDMTWHEKMLFTCLQGLVNREEPQVYLICSKHDQDWLDLYKKQYGIQYETVEDPYELLARFSKKLKGYVVYDADMLDSANVATVFGGIEDAVPVSRDLVGHLRDVGLSELEDFTGRWANRLDAYRWAAARLLPRCNRRLIAGACVDIPHWPSDSIYLRDYLIAHKIFTFDLSSSLRDRQDVDLFNHICAQVAAPGVLLGWHCARDNEHEYVALAAGYGLFVICGTSASNLTVHSAIRPPEKPFIQRHREPHEVKLENKVYISFMSTDGDSMSSMLSYCSGAFAEEVRGQFPYTWGFLPSGYNLMPGVAQFYYDNLTENDYLVAGPSGAAYTYPHLLPKTRDFLRLTRYYMQKTALRAVHMTNWDDEHWWQEVNLPDFVKLLREELPDCLGYVRGLGESAFEPHYIGGGPPYIFCGEGIHRDSDVYSTITDFVNTNHQRPLFIFSLVNFNVSLKRMKEAIDRFPKDEYRLVRLDELFLLIDKAFDQGLVQKDDLYPDKTDLKKLLAGEARDAWPGMLDAIADHAARARLTPDEVVAQLNDTVLKRSQTDPADLIAFDAVWDSMKLVKTSLNMRGVYVNNKQVAIKDFLEIFADVEEAPVVEELWARWLQWREKRVPYETACEFAYRLFLLAQALDKKLRTS